MATAQEIVERSFSYSSANDPDRTASKAEMLVVLNHKLKKYFRRAFRVNPAYFGSSSILTFSGTGWPIPSSMGVYHLQNQAGAEVHVVTVSEKDVTSMPPRVFRIGREYRTVGASGDPPTSETLTAFFGVLPSDVALLTDNLPVEWPEDHEDLLVFELARYLALKDKAREDHDELDDLIEEAGQEFEVAIATADVVEGRFRKVR